MGKRMRVTNELSKLNDRDLYSLVLFALFRLREIPEYSTLSELVYILDEKSMVKLCEYFGGLTIQIPTIEELESIVYSLLIYQDVNINGESYITAVDRINKDTSALRKIKADYERICKILDQYEFVSRKPETKK